MNYLTLSGDIDVTVSEIRKLIVILLKSICITYIRR